MKSIDHTTRLDKLRAKLEAARSVAAKAEAELKKAERREEKAKELAAALHEEFDLEQLRLWGDKPDVAALMKSGSSMAFFYAGEALAEACGLGWGMSWSDTGQRVLHVKLNRGELGAVERIKAGVLYFAPFVKSKRGLKRFGVYHQSSSDFAVELRYSMKTGTAKVARLRFGADELVTAFPTLDAALCHVQEHHWVDDFIDAGTAAPRAKVRGATGVVSLVDAA